MYTIIDLLFAGLIFIIGVAVIILLTISGTTINVSLGQGVLTCLYKYVENGLLEKLLVEHNYLSIESVVRGCGAENAIIECYDGNWQLIEIYPSNTILGKCVQYLSLGLVFNTTEMQRIYVLIICIK